MKRIYDNIAKMMKNRLWIIPLFSLSLTGCYTSFVPRDYEQESYGNLGYYSDEINADNDSLEYYDDSSEYYDDEYAGEDEENITIINNYSPGWGWDNYPVYINTGFNYCGFYDPFYDPYWGPYYYPYYNPYYGGNIYVYGDAYWGSGGSWYYPSQTKYRTERSHWTSLRNNGGRVSTSRDRNSDVVTDKRTGTRVNETRNFDLDRDLRVTRSSGSSVSSSTSKNNRLKTAVIRKDGEVRTTARKTTDLEKRRIDSKNINKDVEREKIVTKKSSSQTVTKKANVQYKTRSNSSTQNRSKRVYSSSESSDNSKSTTSSRSYYKPSSSSNKSSSVSRKTKSSESTSRNYTPPSSSSRPSASSSSSSSSRPSVSSSSRSSGSSSSSSSRSSSSSSSNSSRSSSSSKGKR
ncbi:MAG: hypothetical protein KKF62_04845 [Bacteroidetes bacterium]|nr:hypothetical protein [Bacteroidota bacterium]MBU1797784.1 hypothetical protein [Bacteroidota bacterium]